MALKYVIWQRLHSTIFFLPFALCHVELQHFYVSHISNIFDAGIAQLGEQQTEATDVIWRSRVQSTVLAFFITMSSCQTHLLSSDLKTFIIVFCHNNLCDYFTKFRCISPDVLLDFATPRWTFMSVKQMAY